MKKFLKRAPLVILKMMFLFFGTGLILSVIALSGVFLYLEPRLPAIDSLRDIRLQVPLRIVSRDHKLIAEFGEFRRIPAIYEQIPPQVIQAYLAAEDDRFFTHPGVDYHGILRAGLHLIKTGSKGQGGSTITMQVARNFFLSSEKTYLRKANEILLSFKIEKQLSKEQILELYLNRIFLGHRAYGIGAAAQVYYGKTLNELELHEIAMIAGLPKAPSTMNPITNPQRARIRRDYVLGRMADLSYITAEEHLAAREIPVQTRLHYLQTEVHAPHFAEMIRHEAVTILGEEAYIHGYEIRTSLDSRLQAIANLAFTSAITDYDVRHGYRGAEAHHTLSDPIAYETLDDTLAKLPVVNDMRPGIVIATDTKGNLAKVYIGGGKTIELSFKSMEWARKHLSPNSLGPKVSSVSDVVALGDQVRVLYATASDSWSLAQIPSVDGALIAQDPLTGDVLAMVGGNDFYTSKFNRATQALRQPGSSFKPFLYALALENGFTAATVINDAPVVFDDPGLESSWRPGNYSGRFYGPTRLRDALAQSRNLVSIRLLQSMSLRTALTGLTRLGFERSQLPSDLSLSLGSNNLTPLQLTTAYSVFANGGYRISPNTVLEMVDATEAVTLWQKPAVELADTCEKPPEDPGSLESFVRELSGQSAQPVCAPRVLSSQATFITNSMLQDVIRIGTGRRALSLRRSDLAGKTGTTNDVKDAWFVGYTPRLVASAWLGFDSATTLGSSETGGRSALPMWIDFMRQALESTDQIPFVRPPGIVSIRVNRQTGFATTSQDPSGMVEFFIDGQLPPTAPPEYSPGGAGNTGATPSPNGVPSENFDKPIF